jgi:hypothetical protein
MRWGLRFQQDEQERTAGNSSVLQHLLSLERKRLSKPSVPRSNLMMK